MTHMRLPQIPAAVALIWLLLPADKAAPEEFTLFAPDQGSAALNALSKALCPDKPHSVGVATTLREALDSESEILVLFLDSRSCAHHRDAWLSPESIAKLRERKIIGIGYGAAELFGALGLEIEGGHCGHHLRDKAPEICIEDNALCPEREGERLVAFRAEDGGAEEIRRGRDWNFAMLLPRKHEATQFVEAIARWHSSENYAPVVKQGNHILVGLAAPPSMWTQEYNSFFSNLANSLAKARSVPFSRAKWEITRPGEYGFELAEGRSTRELSGRRFYFRFTEPTEFSAVLQHEGSRSMMLYFRGENGEQITRKDAKQREELRISASIMADDIQKVGQGYWSLKVRNFDPANRAIGRLKIDY